MEDLKSNIEKVENNISAALVGTGRTLSDVKIIAATKTIDCERIRSLPSFGISVAGENKVQELIDKYDLCGKLEWHFIGNLQTNKVKYMIDKVSLIHSLDRTSLADEIDKQAAKIGKVCNALIEVNIGKEESKGGVSEENLGELVEYVLGKKNIKLKGLMAVLPIGADEKLYLKMKELYDGLKQKLGREIDTLSMGMSGDYETAVRAGANMVRLGSVLFGNRIYK